MSCQQVPTTPAFNPYPRSVQVGEFEVAIGGGIWVAIRGLIHLAAGAGLRCRYQPSQRFQKFRAGRAAIPMRSSCS